MTGERVFSDATFNDFRGMFNAIVENDERPANSSYIPEWMMALLQQCWLKDQALRPSIDEVLCCIEDELIAKGSHNRDNVHI